MELCRLLLTAAAVGVASGGGPITSTSGGGGGGSSSSSNSSNSSSSSGGGGGGGSAVLPELRCGPANRRGRRLQGPPTPVQPPPGCLKAASARGAVLCDQPGDNYPWEAIDNYLRHSSDLLKKRVENTLKASRISAHNSIRRRRRGRSTDDVTNTDDVSRDDVFLAGVAGEKVREKKHVEAPSARQRITVAKATPAPRPTTFGPELDDFTELVYASDAQRQPVKAQVRPPTARTTPRPSTTPRPTPDPYTESACEYWEEMRSPFYAMNTHNEWKTLINLPNYETYIHMEHCKAEKSQGRCAEGCRCTQKYTIRNMPVYDRDANGCDVIYMDKFLFPSHCDCKCLPPGYTLFRKPPAPTTPLPEVVESVGPLPEGWLPPRPTEGRRGQGAAEAAEVVKAEEVVLVTDGEEGQEVVTVEQVELGSEGEVKVVEVVEKVEEQKAVAKEQPGRLDLNSNIQPAESTTLQQQWEPAKRVKPSRAPPPAAFLEHVTVRPRRPAAGPLLPSPPPGSAPNSRWQAIARRRPGRRPAGPRPNLRNHLRGPAIGIRRR